MATDQTMADLDTAGDLEGPDMMHDVFVSAFSAANANVAISPTRNGTTTEESKLGAPPSQSFGVILDSAPTGFSVRTPLYTAGIYAAKSGSALAGITLTTAGAQQLYCPVTGACSASIGGQTPTNFFAPDVSDNKDSVLHDLCAARALCNGAIVVANGPSARQWNGTSFVNFPITGVGKPCSTGDSQAVCLRKIGQGAGNFVLGDSRITVGSGTLGVLALDTITPDGTTVPNGTYPRSRAINMVKSTTTDADTRVVNWWLWLDGDGTMAHPDHHSAFIGLGTSAGLYGGSL